MAPLVVVALAAALGLAQAGMLGGEPTAPAAALALLGPGVIVAVLAGVLSLLGRRLDRIGDHAAVLWAGRALAGALLALAGVHVAALGLGWLDAVRFATGDLVLVDEALAVAPALLGMAACWACYFPIDRRLREAMLLGWIDQGELLPHFPSAAGYVLDRVRHGVLLVLVPLALIAAWEESIGALAPERDWLSPVGVLLVVALAPWVLVRVWRTEPIGDGSVRRSLLDMCRAHRVRVADLRLWRTHERMINGALLGLVPRLRYILLTDALLESLPEHEVEAVMAHEIGHARRRHIPWMLAGVVAIVTVISFAVGWPIDWALRAGLDAPREVAEQWGAVGGLLAAGPIALVGFGYVSRRFEWQADAFAVQHLSRGERAITESAAAAMAGALGSVASRSGLPRRRFNFRHGSIAERQRRIVAAVGLPADALPADRVAARTKWAIAVIAGIAGVLFIVALLADSAASSALPS